MPLDTHQREELRHAVRTYLYARPTAAMSVDAIRHHLARHGYRFEAEDVEAAAEFLAGMDPAQVEAIQDGLGASKAYRITSAGTLAHERSQV